MTPGREKRSRSGACRSLAFPQTHTGPRFAFSQNHILFSICTSDFAAKHREGSRDFSEKHTCELVGTLCFPEKSVDSANCRHFVKTEIYSRGSIHVVAGAGPVAAAEIAKFLRSCPLPPLAGRR